MTAATPVPAFRPHRGPDVGIGWRHPHYAALLEQRPRLDFIEVHSENFFAPGGAALAVLREGRASYPVSLHGVGLSLGSACGVDAWHLDQLARLVEAIDPVRVSDHASFARGALNTNPGSGLVHGADLLPIPFTREALDVLCANVQQVQERLRRPIAVENLSAYLRWRDADLIHMPVEFFVDDVPVGAATMETMLDGPFGSALFLIRTLRARGIAIAPGTWVSTGAITGIHEIRPGQRGDALFDGKIRVSCEITG